MKFTGLVTPARHDQNAVPLENLVQLRAINLEFLRIIEIKRHIRRPAYGSVRELRKKQLRRGFVAELLIVR